MRLVLDAQALSVLMEAGAEDRRTVRRAMTAAHELGHEVVVATLALAELYRGTGRSQGLDALLAREEGAIMLRNTDRQLARLVGSVLAQASLGSAQMVDAHAVAIAVEDGGGVVLTANRKDLERLAGPYRTVVVESV